ncbi:MAG: metallopeptidase TldD-related protein [Planctomycetota bacterium]
MKNLRQHSSILGLIAGLAVTSAALAGDDPLKLELSNDIVLRALADELDRGKSGLKIQDMGPPYFASCSLGDNTVIAVTAKLGAVTSQWSVEHSRWLRCDVRVGSYELDQTNFSSGGGMPFFGGGRGSSEAQVPIEDNYSAIRQAVWWAMDRTYKGAVETLAAKKAVMEAKIIEDKPPDFTRAEPVVYFEPKVDLTLPKAQVLEMATTLSGIFRDFPDMKDSGVFVRASAAHRYLVNSEGTHIRTSAGWWSVRVSATVQAEDGMEMTGSLELVAQERSELPPAAELEGEVRKLAQQMLDLRKAPVLDSYSGPVLLDAPVATSMFARMFGHRFSGGQRPVGSRGTDPEDFSNKLQKRILPRFAQAVDDPTREKVNGNLVMGHYLYDEEGVRARPVSLVENGRLVGLLMSRNPSKEFAASTGHGRMYGASSRAAVGCLTLTATEGLEETALRQELVDSAQDEGLPYAIRVAGLGSISSEGRDESGGGNPLIVYRVFPDGREELVRGVQFARVDLKAFKRVLAYGDELFVLNAGQSQTVAAPAMLFEELDLAKIDRDFDKPPVLPAPLARPGSTFRTP